MLVQKVSPPANSLPSCIQKHPIEERDFVLDDISPAHHFSAPTGRIQAWQAGIATPSTTAFSLDTETLLDDTESSLVETDNCVDISVGKQKPNGPRFSERPPCWYRAHLKVLYS